MMLKIKKTITPYGFYYEYGGYLIEKNKALYGNKFNVQYNGDDFLFDTTDEAEDFIEDISEEG